MPLPFALIAPAFTPQARLADGGAGPDSPCTHDSHQRRSAVVPLSADSGCAPFGIVLSRETRTEEEEETTHCLRTVAPTERPKARATPTGVPASPSSLKSQASGLPPPSSLRSQASSLPPEDFSDDEPPVFTPPSREEYAARAPRPPKKEDLPWWEFEELCFVHKLPPDERLRGFCKLSKWVRAEMRVGLDEFMSTPPDDTDCRAPCYVTACQASLPKSGRLPLLISHRLLFGRFRSVMERPLDLTAEDGPF